MKLRAAFIIIVLALLAAITFGTALADGSYSSPGTVGGKNYTAVLGTTAVTAGGWTGYAEASTCVSIDTVGWYWWSTREYCNTTIKHNVPHGGAQDTSYPYTYKYLSYQEQYQVDCPYYNDVHKVGSAAKFDFKYAGDLQSPIFEYIEPLPSGW